MEGTTVILAVGGVAVVGGLGFLYWKSRQPAVPPPSKCGALGTIVGGLAGTMAGPADPLANANANQAATIACEIFNRIPLGKVGAAVQDSSLGKAVTGEGGGMLGAIQDMFSGMFGKVAARVRGCPDGQRSVVDNRSGEPVRTCVPGAPDGTPRIPNRQADRGEFSAYTQSTYIAPDGSVRTLRDHRG